MKICLLENANDQELAECMSQIDLAVAAGGHSLFELAFMGVPTVRVQIIENQAPAVAWDEAGITWFAGIWDNPNLLEKICEGVEFFESHLCRQEKSIRGQSTVDGGGCNRLVQEMKSEVAL